MGLPKGVEDHSVAAAAVATRDNAAEGIEKCIFSGASSRTDSGIGGRPARVGSRCALCLRDNFPQAAISDDPITVI